MRLFMLESPSLWDSTPSASYASFSHTGTWVTDQLCPACGRALSILTEPLLIQWDDGSVVIGDFSYCGYTVVGKQHVRDFLSRYNFEFEYRTTEMVSPKRSVPRRGYVSHSYVESELTWIIPRTQLPLDPQKSGIAIRGTCSLCRYVDWSFTRSGIVVTSQAWNGEKVFEIKQFAPSGAIIFTEAGLELLQGAQFTNFGYHECGLILS